MAQFPGGIEINPVNSMLGSQISGAAQLFGQLQQIKAQKEAIDLKKKEAKFDAATQLFKEAPDALKVQIYNRTLRPMWSEHFKQEIPELNIDDVKKPMFSDMIKTIDGIDAMKGLDAGGKKQLKTKVFADFLSGVGKNKEAVDMLAGDLNSDSPSAVSWQFIGTDPKTGEGVLLNPKTTETRNIPMSGPLGPKNEDNRPTASQSQASEYATRMAAAETVFGDLQNQGIDFTSAKAAALRKAPEGVKPEWLKLQEQAESNFINAKLRRESGAAIAPSEFKSAEQQYFPRWGDTDKVLQQKAANRASVIQSLTAESERRLPARDGQKANPQGNRPPPAATPIQIKGDADFNALPSGTRFIDPDGQVRVKP